MKKQNLLVIAEVIDTELNTAKAEILSSQDPEDKVRLRLMVQILTVSRLGVLRAANMCKG